MYTDLSTKCCTTGKWHRDFLTNGDVIDLINVMHTPLSDVPGAIEVVRNYWKGPVGVYPESGEFMMPNWDFVDVIEPSALAENAVTWAEDGIRLIGGCCGLGPAHIEAVSRALRS